MDFQHETIGKNLIFTVKDFVLDAAGANRFKRALVISMADKEIVNIVVNLQDVKMVDSSGLGALLFARRVTLGKGGRCYLVNPRPKVLNLLKISKLEEAFNILETFEEYKELRDSFLDEEATLQDKVETPVEVETERDNNNHPEEESSDSTED
jgi:anti-anti-sigma factor